MNGWKLDARSSDWLLGLAATVVLAVALGAYALWEPARIAAAQDRQLASDLDHAMTVYSENCVVCHGAAGEGIGAVPALANPGLAATDFETLVKTIARGRDGTAMAAWGEADGGPLGDYVVGELATLIQRGDWQAAAQRTGDLGLTPRLPFTTTVDAVAVSELALLPGGEQLVQGLSLYAANCVACHGAAGEGTALAPALNTPAVAAQDAATLARTVANGVPGTVMAGWDGVLAEEEIAALVALLQGWGELPTGALVATPAPAPLVVTAESLALGESLYGSTCSFCHGPDGQGTPRAPALNVQSLLTATSDAALQQIITMGVPGTAMPAWGDRLTTAEIGAIVGFLRAWEPTAPAVATPVRGRAALPTNMAAGSGPPWLRTTGQSQPGTALPSGGTQP